MAFQAVPQGVKVALEATQNTVPIVNVWHVDIGAAPTLADLNNVAAAFDAWVTSDLSPLQHPSILYQNIVVTDISVPAGLQVTIPVTTGAGSAGGGEAAANAAVVASFRTGFSGRTMRGRTYIGGLNIPSFTDAQHVTVGYAAAVNAAFGTLITNLNALGYKLSVLSRWLNLVLRVTGLLTEITTVITDTTVDSQRRRTAN